MSAGPFLADRMITWFWPWARRWLDNWPRRRVFLFGVMLVGVFFAGYATWQEERGLRAQAEAKQQIAPVSPARNPDGLYQLNELVAEVDGAREDRANGIVTFQTIKRSDKVDATKTVEYRNYLLRCNSLPKSPPPGSFSGFSDNTVIGGSTCAILGLRQ